MAQFEIYFHGLMCFYANEGRFGARDYKTEALIVEDPDHIRKVKTYKAELANFGAIRTSLPSGRADVSDAAFQAYVPHLADAGVSRPFVIVNTKKAIRLALPDADAYVAQLYKYKGVYTLDQITIAHAVCRISLLTVDANELKIITDVGEITVPPEQPWVAILNYTTHDPNLHKGSDNHFLRYSKATNGRPEDIAEVTDDKDYEVTDVP